MKKPVIKKPVELHLSGTLTWLSPFYVILSSPEFSILPEHRYIKRISLPYLCKAEMIAQRPPDTEIIYSRWIFNDFEHINEPGMLPRNPICHAVSASPAE